MLTMSAGPKLFKDRLKDARAASGMSQQELAVASGVALSTVSQLEQGRMGNPRLDTMRALAKALGIGLDELAGPGE